MSDQQKIEFLGDLVRLPLKPDDILVLKVPVQISFETAERFREAIKAATGRDNKIVVLSGGVDIGVLAPGVD